MKLRTLAALVLTACTPAAAPQVIAGIAPVTEPEVGAAHPTPSPSLAPPVARKVPHTDTLHGAARSDDYYWLREKGTPEVVAYLNAEKQYADAMTREAAPLRETLYKEMLGRMKETDVSVPERRGAWLYYARTEEGKSYPIYCRKRAPKAGTHGAAALVGEGPEVVLLDLNELAKTEKFVAVGRTVVSDDGNLFAYELDTTGFRQFTLHVKDLRTGLEAKERIERVGDLAFARDNRTLFYVVEDAQTKRSHRAYRHVVGTDPAKDPLVYEERDERFSLVIERSRSRAFVYLASMSKTTTEVRVIPADAPTTAPRVLVPREPGHEYFVQDGRGRFYVRTNSGGRNFRLVSMPTNDTSRKAWRELIPHRERVMLEDVEVFADHYVTVERENALARIRITDLAKGTTEDVAFTEPAYALYPGENAEYASQAFRFSYESFVTPPSIYDVDMTTHARTLLKRTETPNYDASLYATARAFATAKDGTKIPLSMLYKKGASPSTPHPLMLEAYGSYGLSFDADFRSTLLSLVDRGFVYVVAHIRGGGDGGKRWHDEGRMMAKMNTFTDFIAAGEHLVHEGWTTPKQMVIRGTSAGGLLMGAVTNLRPDLWKAVVARVPFVDVINTMNDETLPLTVAEFEEWGNPKNKTEYDAMMAYSPYDNIAAKAYPTMLVVSSYNDSQVMYWEPAKWVAKLRAMKTDTNPLLFKINMDPAGHGGASGRYDQLRERAFEYAFALEQVGLASP